MWPVPRLPLKDDDRGVLRPWPSLLSPANRRFQTQTQAGVLVVVNQQPGKLLFWAGEHVPTSCRGRVADPAPPHTVTGQPDQTLVCSRCTHGAASIRNLRHGMLVDHDAKQQCREAHNDIPYI